MQQDEDYVSVRLFRAMGVTKVDADSGRPDSIRVVVRFTSSFSPPAALTLSDPGPNAEEPAQAHLVWLSSFPTHAQFVALADRNGPLPAIDAIHEAGPVPVGVIEAFRRVYDSVEASIRGVRATGCDGTFANLDLCARGRPPLSLCVWTPGLKRSPATRDLLAALLEAVGAALRSERARKALEGLAFSILADP